MSSPLMRLRDREWHSPASQRFVDQGDRFIPTRSLMNLDFARSSLMRHPRRDGATVDRPEILTPKEEYRRRVEENWTLDSQGKPLKMLVFRGSPRKSHPSVLMVDEMLKEQREPPRSIRRIRHLPQSADRILDGPELIDDYYLNLMDWGKSNILAVALGRSLCLWNAANSMVQLLLTTDVDDHPTSAAWSVDGKMVAVGFASSKVEIWDAIALQQVRILEGHLARVGSLSWTWNMLSSGSRDASIINHDGIVLLLLLQSSIQKMKGTNAIIYAVRSFRHVSSKLKAHTGDVCGLKWSCGGDLLASGGNDNLVHVWESSKMGSSRYLHRFTDHRAAVRALAWCPFQPKTLASGGGTADQCVCALEWNRHQKEILSAHGYNQNRLSLWAYPSLAKITDFTGHTDRILQLSQSPDGSTVVSAAADETIRFWKVFEPTPCSSPSMDDEDRLFSLKRMHIR
ncbi:unnamed protein product [Musa hybrid cultivar]